MNDELTEFLEKRQEQILDERTDKYGRFKSSKDESFYYGYLECMQDRYNFFENQKMEQYNRIAYAVENGDTSEFDNLSEKDKECFREHFEDWESKHCVCYEARREGVK